MLAEWVAEMRLEGPNETDSSAMGAWKKARLIEQYQPPKDRMDVRVKLTVGAAIVELLHQVVVC
jgi:hypothetical protein